MFDRARKFIYEQRIEELRKAIERWPSSDRYQTRVEELSELEGKLEEINRKILSS